MLVFKTIFFYFITSCISQLSFFQRNNRNLINNLNLNIPIDNINVKPKTFRRRNSFNTSFVKLKFLYN